MKTTDSLNPVELELETARMNRQATIDALKRAADSMRFQMDALLKRLDGPAPMLNTLGEAQTASELNRLCAVYGEQDRAVRVLEHLCKKG